MTRMLNLKAAVLAGVIAGLIFLMLEMAMVALFQGMSPWGPPRMMAAIVMGKGVLPPMEGPVTFDFGVVMVAMIVHMALTIIYGVVLGALAARLNPRLAGSVILGALFGVALYYVNFYGFTSLFPWFAMARGPISLFAHAVYGLVLGLAYCLIARQTVRAGETAPA